MRWQLCLWLVLAAVVPVRADDVDDMLRCVPPYMNTIAVFRVDNIMKSPRALKEEWGKKHQLEYMAGASSIPSNASVAVVAAHLDVNRIGTTNTVAMIPLGFNVNMNELAGREKGSLQLLGGQQAILSPRRGYIINLNNKILATSSTFDRQDLGRWVRFAMAAKDPVYSKYLQEAAAMHKKNHILIAMDLQDMYDATAVRIEVMASNVAQGSAYVEDNFSKFLFGLRGFTIAINFDEMCTAEFRLDFEGKATDWEKQLTAFLPKFIAEIGAELDELKDAKLQVQDKSVFIKTEFCNASLRRILSLISAPSANVSPNMLKTDAKDTANLTATLRYYRAVNQVINDLGQFNNKKQTDYNNSAVWYESFANKIDRLSIQGVDEEMLNFGGSISNKLRALAGSLRGLKIQLDAYDSYTSYTYVGTSGGWGWRSGGGSMALDSNVGTIRTKQADLVAKTAPDRIKVWSTIEQDRSLVRRKMADKYKIDFDQFN